MNAKVLIVYDDQEIRNLISIYLGNDGLEINFSYAIQLMAQHCCND